MIRFHVGVGYFSLYLRHSRGLKDRRQVIQSIKQRLSNLGFSVSEHYEESDVKRAALGFTIIGVEHSKIERAVEEAARLFVGDFDILQSRKELFDYSDEDSNTELPWHSEFRE